MDNLAKNYQPAPTDTGGLDDLFEVVVDDSHCDSRSEQSENQVVLTASDASVQLGIPLSTLYRQIRAGKFKTSHAADGSVRIILPVDSHAENQVIPIFATSENRNEPVILTDSHSENQSNHVILSDSHCENHRSSTDNEMSILLEMSKKLEAASYRIGWLESQLQERDKELKLLTDSQSKPTWLTKITNWFKGGR